MSRALFVLAIAWAVACFFASVGLCIAGMVIAFKGDAAGNDLAVIKGLLLIILALIGAPKASVTKK